MGLLSWIERILTRAARPKQPAPSVFGADADRAIADRSAAEDYELEIEKQKGRPRGF